MSCDEPSKKPKPEFPPLLAAGFHVLSEDDLRDLTVAKFKSSTRREPLWESLLEFCDDLRNAGLIPCRVWIDGSYLTRKTEPDDIDLLVEVDAAVVDRSLATGSTMAEDIYLDAWHHEPRCLHTFLLPIPPIIHREYPAYVVAKARWERDWGHALLSRQPKGIALLEVGT